MINFYVAVGEDRRGPFTIEQLRSKIVPLLPTTLVWRCGMSDWAEAAGVSELETLLMPNAGDPPPFSVLPPSASLPTSSGFPRWIATYAIVVTPIIWLLQRIANMLQLASLGSGDGTTFFMVLVFGWSLVTMVVTAMTVAGGLQQRHNLIRRSMLLLWGVRCRVALHVVIFLIAGLAIAASTLGGAPQQARETVAMTAGDVTGSLGLAIWMVTVAVDVVAWRTLHRIPPKCSLAR